MSLLSPDPGIVRMLSTSLLSVAAGAGMMAVNVLQPYQGGPVPYLAALALLAAGLTLFAGMAHWRFFWLWPILMTAGAVEFHAAIIGVRVMVLYPDVFAALFSPALVGALLVGVWFWWRARRRVEGARVS